MFTVTGGVYEKLPGEVKFVGMVMLNGLDEFDDGNVKLNGFVKLYGGTVKLNGKEPLDGIEKLPQPLDRPPAMKLIADSVTSTGG